MKTAKSRKGCIDNPNLTYQAEPREVKLRKIINGESNDMEDGVFPTIYTEKKDGVQPEFDIRTDRFEVAIDAMDKINQSIANQVAKSKGETEAVKDFGTEEKTNPEKS
jgi:hypothetical protein|nr:MAG TPA: hypothetical protein [Microviridae sp.]